MPKPPTITREALLDGAFRLVRERGHEALSARNLAAFLGCSTQPVMYQFPSLETLRAQCYQRVDEYHSAYLLADGDLLEIGLRYVRFAAEEPRLFRFLFQSGRFEGLRLEDLIRAPEAAGVLAAVQAEAGLDAGAAVAFFEPLAAMVHGYASLIANNAMPYDPASIAETLQTVAENFFKKGEEE